MRHKVTAVRGRPKPRHLTLDQEHSLELAERENTRALVYELGVAAYLKSQACGALIVVARDVLAEAVEARERASDYLRSATYKRVDAKRKRKRRGAK